MADKIRGGFVLKARCIQESEIQHAPPHVREIWDWLLMQANHKGKNIGGKTVERGQCIRTYQDIIDGLSWYVGYRKMSYSKGHCETALKWLTKRQMIAKTKTTRGLFITILNYNHYQNPKNYENHNETDNKPTREPQWNHTINKNEKNKEIKDTCAEQKICPPPESIFITLPLVDKTDFLVTNPYVKELSELFPAVDVPQQMRNMKAWLDANPKKKKTPSGIKKFIAGWLTKEQNKGGIVQSNRPEPRSAAYREYTG